MNFLDRFEPLDLLHEGEIQTIRVRERATGRTCEAHFAVSPELLNGLHGVIDRGSHEGKWYAVVGELVPLDSAGAWRVKPAAKPAPEASPAAPPGDFTRMFQLRQAPEPIAAPVSKPVSAPVSVSQPGEFTRAFQRPSTAPVAPSEAPVAGQPGDFTRMFQQPGASAAKPASPALKASDTPVPESSGPASHSKGALIVVAIAVLFAIAVFVWMRTLY